MKENKHAKVRVAAWKVTLPLRGEQSLDKERDIRGIENNACVSNNGPAQAHPMGGKDFITSDQRGSLSPFCECWVSMLGANPNLP